MTENVTTMQNLESYNDMMTANAQLMSEVYTDPKLTAAEKMKTFSAGVRNQIMLSRDLAARRAELMKFGMKARCQGHGLAQPA
jgi:prophage DNA circulation protein